MRQSGRGVVAFAVVMLACATPARPSENFSGKTVSVIIGAAAGAGFDAYGRAVAHQIGRFLPGNPMVIPRNQPGAGSGNAAAYIYNIAPKDGTAIASLFPGVIVSQLLDERPSGLFDPKQFNYLGSVYGGPRICLTYGQSKIKTFKDLQRKKATFGATAVGGGTRDYANMVKRIAGAKFDLVTGYKGPNDIYLAIERGELDGICGQDWSAFKLLRPAWLENKTANILLQIGPKPDAELTSMGVPNLWSFVTNAARMTLILSNEEIADLLPMSECLAWMEAAYRELGGDRAISRPRTDMVAPAQEGSRYIFKTMDGLLPKYEIAALRLNSDVIRWTAESSSLLKKKVPAGTGGTWIGLVLLFSTRTGEPLAILPDGVIQQLRVAATQAIGAKYLARPDAAVYAQIGSGWQASGQAWAMAHVRKFREIRVYSPTKSNRERLAATLRDRLGIAVRAVDDAAEAARGADIVGSATNSLTPAVKYDWLSPGAHVNAVKTSDVDVEVLDHCQQVVLHTHIGEPANYVIGRGEQPIFGHDPKEILGGAVAEARAARVPRQFDPRGFPDITQIVSGSVAAARPGSLTCFLNNMGHGVQFAALGALALDRARQRRIGRTIPTEWFRQTVHS